MQEEAIKLKETKVVEKIKNLMQADKEAAAEEAQKPARSEPKKSNEDVLNKYTMAVKRSKGSVVAI